MGSAPSRLPLATVDDKGKELLPEKSLPADKRCDGACRATKRFVIRVIVHYRPAARSSEYVRAHAGAPGSGKLSVAYRSAIGTDARVYAPVVQRDLDTTMVLWRQRADSY